MGRRVIDVFLSSTAVDLADYRKAVHERLMRTGLFHCVRQEDFGAQNAGAVEFCRQKAQEADMFVGLIGLRRGWEPDGDNEKRSITEMEHDWARDAGPAALSLGRAGRFPRAGQYARERRVARAAVGVPQAREGRRRAHRFAKGLRLAGAARFRDRRAAHGAGGHDRSTCGDPARGRAAGRPSKEEQAPAIAAAVERLAEDKDVDLLTLAKNPQGIGISGAGGEAQAREEEQEARRQHAEARRISAAYRALAFLQDTKKALDVYQKAMELD